MNRDHSASGAYCVGFPFDYEDQVVTHSSQSGPSFGETVWCSLLSLSPLATSLFDFIAFIVSMKSRNPVSRNPNNGMECVPMVTLSVLLFDYHRDIDTDGSEIKKRTVDEVISN